MLHSAETAPVHRRAFFNPALWVGAVIAGIWVSAPSSALAQLSVQQPSFSTFSAATTVSVPDRGRTLVGGMGRAASGRSQYGPFRSGTNYGRSLAGSSVSAHVQIHDFAEMDRRILNSPTNGGLQSVTSRRGPKNDETRLNERAEHAYQTLRGRTQSGL